MSGETAEINPPVVACAKAQQKRAQAGLAAAKKMEAAVKSLNDYLRACNQCGDGSGDAARGISDGRHILIRDMSEYSGWLSSKYSR